jgi:hypothetical protein
MVIFLGEYLFKIWQEIVIYLDLSDYLLYNSSVLEVFQPVEFISTFKNEF